MMLTMQKGDDLSAARQHHEQMLKLVAKGFYNELINYGVNEAQIVTVAGHLLDNVIPKGGQSAKNVEFYNTLFSLKDVKNEWAAHQRLAVQQVSLAPLDIAQVPQILAWLRAPAIRSSFHPRFPETDGELRRYFQSPGREYLAIFHEGHFSGIIGAENLDAASGKLEMRKLVGDSAMHGQGIGKRATFLFLYHVFVIRKFRKVYLHSLDINIRNLNLNGKFGFELEGVFLEDAVVDGHHRDVVRMALAAPVWLELFS
jgi:RimJ/RimL family protein N-acetyltransferase